MPEWYSNPNFILASIFILAGFVVLIKGADVLIIGGVGIAKKFNMTPAVIGATIIAFGTSLPELMVSVFSTLEAAAIGNTGPDGPAAISVANVVGSNIFNIGAVLGVAALFKNLPISKSSLKIDWPLALLASATLIIMSQPWCGSENGISRIEGFILFVALIGYIFLLLKTGKTEEVDESIKCNIPKSILFISLGIIMLWIGGELLLTGALKIAKDIGMSERVIGLTVMSIGTSLPELVTSIQAARKGHAEMAVANVLGSCCFNILCVLGISGIITNLPVGKETLNFDYWWMIAFMIVIMPMVIKDKKLHKTSGAFLLIATITYIIMLLI